MSVTVTIDQTDHPAVLEPDRPLSGDDFTANRFNAAGKQSSAASHERCGPCIGQGDR